MRPDGTRRWVQSTSARVEWAAPSVVIIFLRDITELRDASQREADLQDQLRQAQKLEAVGLLAGGVAHDLNNLLQVIGGNAMLAGDPACSAEARMSHVAEIGDAVRRASQMTRQLLAGSRSNAGLSISAMSWPDISRCCGA